MNNTTHNLKVNMAERGQPKKLSECAVTLDWAGMDAELVQELAAERVLQGMAQRFKAAGHVPATYTYKVCDFGTRKRDPLAAARTLTREELIALCAERGLEIAE